MTNGGRIIRGFMAILIAGLLTAGCQGEPIAPSELGESGPSQEQGSGAPSSRPPEGATPEAGGQAIDVCALVPPDVVRALVGASKIDEVPEPLPTATTTPPPGAPPIPAAYRCTYQWTAGQLILSVLPDSGADTPQAAVDTVLGTPNKAVPDIGEAAAVDRSGRLGNGYAFLAAAKQTGTNVGAVLVRAPTATTDDKLATLAKHLLAAL